MDRDSQPTTRHVHIELTEDESEALADVLVTALRGTPGDDPGDAVATRLLSTLDAHVAPPVALGLPERDVLTLPVTRIVLAGPGVSTAGAVHAALVADGRDQRSAWEGAALEVGRELAAATLAGVHPATTRPLARVHRAVLAEATTQPARSA